MIRTMADKDKDNGRIWRDIRTELPNEYDSVLVYDGYRVHIAHIEYDPDGIWIRDDDDLEIKQAQYWYPLPLLPPL